MKPFNNLENKNHSDTDWRVQLECKKVQAHSSLEPPLIVCNEVPAPNPLTEPATPFWKICFLSTLFCSTPF